MSPRVPPMGGLLFEVVQAIDANEDYTEAPDRNLTTDVEKATVITSRVDGRDGMHKVVLDLDLPAKLVPSSTEGHFHLYVDHELSWERYSKLLDALADAGLIENGYAGASQARGHTAARLPWVKKKAVS